MKKIIFALSLIISVSSCDQSQNKEEASPGNNNVSTTISTDLPPDDQEIKEIISKPLAGGADKYMGEFRTDENTSLKLVLRKHPTEEGLIARNLYINEKTPGMVPLWYDQQQDQVTNRFTKAQTKFTTMKLVESGDALLEVNINLETNESDTVIYKRSQ